MNGFTLSRWFRWLVNLTLLTFAGWRNNLFVADTLIFNYYCPLNIDILAHVCA